METIEKVVSWLLALRTPVLWGNQISFPKDSGAVRSF